MKQLLLLSCLLFTTTAFAQIERIDASPKVTFSTTVGLTEVTIVYGSPRVRGRTIFSVNGLAPFGEVWRTGANWATHISFSDDIVLAGTELAAGDYAFLAVPGAESWSIRFYPYQLAGWRYFLPMEPTYLIQVNPQHLSDFQESLRIGIDNNSLDAADLFIVWENTRVILPIQTSAKAQTLSRIERVMNGPILWDYLNAAGAIHDADGDLELALTYLTKAEVIGGIQNYRTFIQRAQILESMGRRADALAAAQQALPLSIADDNSDFRILIERTIAKLQE